MRLPLLFFSLLFLSNPTSWSQPANDNCSDAIALGTIPMTCTDQIYTSTRSTPESSIEGPSCFNARTAPRDVWFSFNTGSLRDVSVVIFGRPDGPGGRSITNPQVALYRGSCGSLSELACASSEEGEGQVRLDMQNLSRNTDYLLRVSDYSATASPNFGDFTICVSELITGINIGDVRSSSECFGTLYDSGGPDGNYQDQENYTFTICPDQPTACIEFEMVDFATEGVDNLFGEDRLNFYAGDNTDGPLIASVYGVSDGSPFIIQSPGPCVTVEFVSDFFVELSGFELTWQCSATPCDGSSADNPTPIPGLPYFGKGLSTCDGAATVGSSPCANDAFMAGPDYVFTYDSPGDLCLEVLVEGAAEGTGVVVLDGPPGLESTSCVATSANGLIGSVNVQEPGTYYIVVSKDVGCTDFSLQVKEANCALSPALADALRTPLNGCVNENGLPSIFVFENGFQDMDIRENINSGCWLNVGAEADFYWFTLQSQTEGTLGFILSSADLPSDIDLNVWGPFSPEQVVNAPEEVIDYIANNQPIRSSWSPGPEPTGLVFVNPITGRPVTDDYDCEDEPGARGDDYVRAINTQPGEVYVILVNDWGNAIQNGGIAVDWSPTTLGLLDPVEPEVIRGDTAICVGDTAQIQLEIGTNQVEWIGENTATLTCTDCPNPRAFPDRTTTYTAVVESVCLSDTIDVTVQVLALNAGEDQVVCEGETIQIVGGEAFDNATYQWSSDPESGIEFSCTDCPDPFITLSQSGAYQVSVTLSADNEGCTLTDEVNILVSDNPAPVYDITDRKVDICEGTTVTVGVDDFEGDLTFSWTSEPAGFTSGQSTFQVTPDQTTRYYVEISNGLCPVPSRDSVVVTVFEEPVIDVREDTTICVGDTIQLGFGPRERDVTYNWTSVNEVFDPTDPQTKAVPLQTDFFTLTAVRGACVVSDRVEITVNPANVEIPEDTLFFCLGEERNIGAIVSNPIGQNLIPTWTSNDPDFETITDLQITVSPTDTVIYRAEVSFDQCTQTDSVLVVVDSLPSDLAIMPADTSICEGQFVIFRTPAYETSDYPDIEFLWMPSIGQQSPDSLLNMVVTPDTTTTYYRITTNNGCRDSTAATVEVKPLAELMVIPSDTLLCFGEEIQFTLEKPGELEDIMWSPTSNLRCPGGDTEEIDCEEPIATAFNTVDYTINAMFDGCPVSGTARIRVQPQPEIQLTGQTVICLGESVQLNSASTPGATYVWTSTDPSFGTVTDPTPVVSPTETTTYFLNASINNPDITCEPLMVEITIEVIGEVDLQVEAVPPTICAGEELTLRGTAIGGSNDDRYLWTRADGEEFRGPEVTDRPDESTTYFLTYRSAGDCQTINRVIEVTVNPGIDVSIETDVTGEVPEGEEVPLEANIFTDDPGPLEIIWTENGAAISGTENSEEIVVTPTADGTEYTVTVTTPAGCTATDQIVFDVTEPQFSVPNAFTPNGDGANDRFRLLFTGGIDQITVFQVFNRWGKMVYNNENGVEGWDGTLNGDPQPSDVYAYIIEVRTLGGNIRTFQGEVTLIR